MLVASDSFASSLIASLAALITISPRALTDTPDTGGQFTPLTPAVVANTSGSQSALGTTPFAIGESRTMAIAGHGGVPSSAVSAVVVEARVTNQTTAGSLSIFADDDDTVGTQTSDVTFDSANATSGFTIAQLGADGGITVRSTGANVNVALSIQGYFNSGEALTPGGYAPIYEQRALDLTSAKIGAGQTLQLP